MKVTANVLMNYIRCRRYASLNDPNVEYISDEFEITSKNVFREYLDLFAKLYLDTEYQDKNMTLTYDFHNLVTLSENYHFIKENEGKRDIYILLPSTSREYLETKYKCENHQYRMFTKNRLGIYEVNKKDVSSDSSNFDEKVKKLTKRTEDIGRITYNYAFRRYLYDIVNPNNNDQIYFVLLNHEYVHDGKEYTKQLFSVFNLSGLYEYYNDLLEADIYRMINHLELNDFTPCNLIRKECRKGENFQCKFVDFCFSHIPKENSILSYFHSNTGFTEPKETGDIHHDTYSLINEGKVDMLDIPISWLKDEKHLMQRYCIENDYVHIDKPKIEAILKTLKYPLIYLDFEALPCLLPRYFGEKPYTQSVFQYSIHIEHKEGSLELNDKNHYEFLANPEYDNRRELVVSMISLINKYDSSVVVYHKTFEEQRLKEFQTIFPEYKEELQKIIDRLFDLIDVVKNNKRFYKMNGFKEKASSRYNFYSPILNGSYSLKKVIKVFAKDAYNDLEIKNGEEAYKVFMNLSNFDQIDKENHIQNLLEYCKQDTYAMFQIIQGLKKYLSPSFHIT
jgi:hypothetical protein